MLSATENTLYFMTIDPVFTSYIMLMTSDPLIATLSSFYCCQQTFARNMISYCAIRRCNYHVMSCYYKLYTNINE